MADITGNLSPNNADFLPQFKAIGQGLKKRFFRKPNVAEAIEQYEDLALELQRENQTEFAAICYMEAAKCHEPLKNPIQQANLLLKSGRFYLAARDGQRFFQDDYNCLFFRSESLHSSLTGHTQMAVQCLSQAAKIYKREKFLGLSVLVTLEIAEALFKEGAYGESLKYYRLALETVRSNFTYIDVVLVTEQMIRCKLEMTDYDSALKLINDTLIGIGNCNDEEISPEFRTLFSSRLEISRVCLLMLLGTNTVDVLGFIWPEGKPTVSSVSTTAVEPPQDTIPATLGLKSIVPAAPPVGSKGDSTSPSSSSTATAAASSSSVDCEMQVKRVQTELKSLVIAVQHGSIDSIEDVHSHLAPIMQPCHHNLFTMLIKILS